MNCPVCKENNLQSKNISNHLKSFNCSKCNGLWIRLDDYLKWLNNANKKEYELITQEEIVNSSDSKKFKTQSDNSNNISKNCIEGYENYSTITADEKHKINEVKKAKLCPDCGRILIKYKINNSIKFIIESCGTCSGNWYDENKWQFLENNNLQDKVYRFFTLSWQKKIREESTKNFLQKKYLYKFGKSDYDKIIDFKSWLDTSKNRRELLAYLLKAEPYK
ncbi:MAG: zf-TFIIB domain-containing protein [Clostridiales bacterium]